MAVYSFGSSKYGQLGLTNEIQERVDPYVISALKGKKVVYVSCGESHSAAITEYGDLYTWGRGREGQLGNGDRLNSSVPVLVESLSHERIVKVACGNYHTVALSETGKVYTWGKIHRLEEEKFTTGQANSLYLGVGVSMPGMGLKNMLDKSHIQYLSAGLSQEEQEQLTTGKDFGKFANVIQSTPLLVEGLPKRVVAISAGYSFTAAVTDAGQLYTWGFNEKGQLGLGHRFNCDAPRLVHALHGVHLVGVACGAHHALILDEHGRVYSMGLGVFGQLGHNNVKDLLSPACIETFVTSGIKVAQVACGNYHSVCKTTKGEMYSFGHGEYGQHGGSSNYYDLSAGAKAGKDAHLFHSIPRIVEELKDIKLAHVSCGQLHSIAIAENHQIYAWGWGASGCLGHGDKRYQLAPRLINALQGEEISCAAAGWKHTLVVKSGTTSTFAFDFQLALNDPRYSDIKLVVQGKAISVHKVIICNRCPYLARILLFHTRFVSNGFSPAEFTLRGIKHPIVYALLAYLYTDHVVIAPHLTKELALLARKWELPRLEALCNRATYRAWRSPGLEVDPIPPSLFSVQMKEAVNSRSYSDLSFMVNSEPIRAHRMILAARCPYFQRMFEGKFKERDQDVFNIEDGTATESFLAMLEFLYTGAESVVQDDNVVELLALADRFMVEDLKQLCEYFLERSVENYAVLLNMCENTSDPDIVEACDSTIALLEVCIQLLDRNMVADRYLARRLKRVCLEIMCSSGEKNWKLIFSAKGFTDLRSNSPHIIREIDFLATKNGLTTANSVIRGCV